MSYKATVIFNSSAVEQYSSQTVEFPEIWAYDYSGGSVLMLNFKVDADSDDNLLFLPWRGIDKIVMTPESTPSE